VVKRPPQPPVVTTTLSMPQSRPLRAFTLAAISSLKLGSPPDAVYFVNPSRAACAAPSMMCVGVGKFGSPMPRFRASG
jgi:hypothetical protein